ncbi:hypothetical protein AMJ74_05790 [candidate division WOR_3 bacterium SM1_77]|jgi:hypothetical protein|uniref:Uncharacterized protein n=1 Tax=candidate division WOR_3 bacterium SM1_77 TaxID=1703778 RepID=A0A0S8JU21_UNCW3|nr:MAG: hypothetical protein AMJ74_05790 [candidate division WOR_3 bacterium SM1_77]
MREHLPLLFIMLFLIAPYILHADMYTTMKGVMNDMSKYVDFLEDSLDQEIVHMQADIITTKGTTFTRTLHQGWTYGIAAFGDWRIKDLDITIYMDIDGEWIEVISEDESDNHPVVAVEPAETNTYLIELTVYKWDEDYTAAHYGMLIYHEVE